MAERADIPSGLVERDFIRAVEDEPIQLDELAPLALPSHPAFLARIPFSVAVEQVEGSTRGRTVLVVELLNASLQLPEQLCILGHSPPRCIGEVRKQSEGELPVRVGEIVRLQLPDQ